MPVRAIVDDDDDDEMQTLGISDDYYRIFSTAKKMDSYLVRPSSILNYDSTCLERWCFCTTNVKLQHYFILQREFDN
jgi:hypothetical protein